MPRGFLVKRTNRAAPVSYRVRSAEEGQSFTEASPSLWGPPAAASSAATRSSCYGMPDSPCAPSRSPDRPESGQPGSPGRPVNSSSPVLAESFPSPSTLASSLGRAVFVASVSDEEVEMGSNCTPIQAVKRQLPAVKAKAHGKRPRTERKAYRDEVTTSPVLGLRITKELMDYQQPKVSGQPLGEFICQLCKEEYADALSLAQHRCSRIVRVEYRCTECDKVFSCPANLASHCRWHKPKNPGSLQGQEVAKDSSKSKTKAESQRESCNSSPQSCDYPSPEDDMFDCPLCGKKFRRQAYLRKHMATHRPPVLLPGSQQFLQQPTAELEKPGAPPQHGLRLTFAAAEDVPVKPCPETSYIPCPIQSRQDNSKCQPLESRQVVLLQLSTAHTVI
ncbi:insulinoma-associated protein 1-like [Pristis pectinata]|uniref:insulinoma-associated protein 1-like n=1 Tax=Pristis pectinata TaxID=685728 RepID=UPI00223CA7D6|nr:insulinoma-associated protein 1-like [Pristis pectinata]